MQDHARTSGDLKSLLNRISEDDESAFRDVFEVYSPKVYAFALRLTDSPASAEEMVQEVFLKVWVNRRALRDISYFPSYLYAIARNMGFNLLKRMAVEEKAKAVFSRRASSKNETEDAVIFEDYQHILQRAVDLLPPQQKVVYSLCRGEGMKYEEAAKKLQISPLTVKSHMQQAMRALRTHFRGIIAAVFACLLCFY